MSCGRTVTRQYVSPVAGARTMPRQGPSSGMMRSWSFWGCWDVCRYWAGCGCRAKVAIAWSTERWTRLSSLTYSVRKSFEIASRATWAYYGSAQTLGCDSRGAYCLYASRVIIRHAPMTDQPTIQPTMTEIIAQVGIPRGGAAVRAGAGLARP